jgi:hypothetical protein
LDGWNWTNRAALAPYNSGNDLVIAIFNNTPDAVKLKFEAKQGELLQPTGHEDDKAKADLSPGQVGFAISQNSLGLETEVKIRDASDRDELAKFHAHQNLVGTIGHQTWVDHAKDDGGYELASATINNAVGRPGQILATLTKT